MKKLWWYNEFDDVKIPYAITEDAVEYYTQLVEAYRQREWLSDIEPKSKFKYRAEVFFEKKYEKDGKQYSNVYVVKMDLAFNARFGSLSSVSFTKERIVVINTSGVILLIFGDGVTSFLVS